MNREEEYDRLVDDAILGRAARAIAHDFAGFFQAIGTASSLCALGKLGADHADRAIQATCDLGGKLAHQVLCFGSRGQTRQLVELVHTLTALSPLLQCLAHGRATLTVRLIPEAAFVRSKPGEVERIVFNLVSNAVAAVPERGGEVEVILETSESHACIVVRDDGVGMAQSQAKPARRGETDTRDSGWGLGLSIVKGSVANLGGTLALTSEPIHGTTARITLPLVS